MLTLLIQIPQTLIEDLIEIAKIIVIVLGAFIADRLVSRYLRSFARIANISVEALGGLKLIIRFLILAVALIFLSSVKWFPTEYLAGGGALMGAIVGIALATTVSNFFSGAFVLFSRVISVGDYIRFDSDEGLVVDMSINFTKIRKSDGSTIIISNKDIASKKIVNFRAEEKGETYYVYPLEFSTSIEIPMEKVEAVIAKIEEKLRDKIADIKLKIEDITRLEIKYKILFKVRNAELIPEIKDKIYEILAETLLAGE